MAATSMPGTPERRVIPLHRSNAVVTSNRIDVRPARVSVAIPLAGFLLGGLSFVAIVLWIPVLPYFALVLLLLTALVFVPLGGIGLVYSVMGAKVVVDRSKQSATWQQGFLGMGIGTTDLVPFDKVAEIVIRDANAAGEDGRAGPDQQLAQWETLLRKTSGRELKVGLVTVPGALAADGLARARDLADALSEMTGKPVRAPELPADEPDGEAAAPTAARERPRRRRRRKRARRP